MPKYNKDIILNVRYSEKDEAKAQGARWNPDEKYWYIPANTEVGDLSLWMDVTSDGLDAVISQGPDMRYNKDVNPLGIYLVVGNRTCFKCGKTTKVIAFGIPYASADEGPIDSLSLCPRIKRFPAGLEEWLMKTYNYKERYSNVTELCQLNNCCRHCDVLQGEFYLFQEPDLPFSPTSREDCEALEYYKLDISRGDALRYLDSIVPFRWSSSDHMLYETAVQRARRLTFVDVATTEE